jgi:glycine/D-amino acid oxidase-like deaminating enzyme
MGASSALEVAKRGLKVAVVDKTYVGHGPTGQSSAIIRQHYSIRRPPAGSPRGAGSSVLD